VGAGSARLCSHSELPIVRYLPMERRISVYGYSARRSSDIAGVADRYTTSEAAINPVAKGNYAARGYCVGEMDPACPTGADAQHMPDRYSGRQWANSEFRSGNLDNHDVVIRPRSHDLRPRSNDRLLVGRKESLKTGHRIDGDSPAGIHRESACVGLGSVITMRGDIVGEAEYPGRIGGPIKAVPLDVGADHQIMADERLAL